MDYNVADTFFETAMPDTEQLLTATGEFKYMNDSEAVHYCCAAEMMRTELDTLFCLAFYYTGCRMTEVLMLTPRHIHLQLGVILSRTLKQRGKIRYRLIPVDKRYLKRLLKFIKKHDIQPHERIWTFSRWTGLRRIKDCMGLAQINDSRANSRTLRHTFASACTSKGVPLNLIQKLLGHALLKTTMIYTNIMGPEERKMVSRIWPSPIRIMITLAFMRLVNYLKYIATK